MPNQTKKLSFKLPFHSEGHKELLDREYPGKHDFKSFDDYTTSMMSIIIDAVYKEAEKHGFYHADQLNVTVEIAYQENEG